MNPILRWLPNTLCRLVGLWCWAVLLQIAPPGSAFAQSATPLQAVRGTALDLAITPEGIVVVLDPDGTPWIQRLGNGNNWNRLPGTFRAVRAGQDASLWAIGTDDQPYRLIGAAWRGMPLGAVRDLAVTPDGVVYTLSQSGALQVWAGGNNVLTHAGFETAERILADEHGLPWLWTARGYLARFDGTRWAQFDQFTASGLSSVAVGADGTMLLIDGRGQLQRWDAASGDWALEQVQLPMRSVAIGPNGKPWFVAATGQLLASEIFALQGAVARPRPPALFTKLLTWKRVRGAAQWLSVGADGTVVTIDPENRAWRWKGGDTWTPLPGTFRRAAVAGNGAVWGITLQNRLMRNATGQWIDMGIDAAEVGAGPNEEVWVIDAAGALGRYDTTTRQWVGVPGGPVKAITVGRNGEAWVADAAGAVRNVTRAAEFPGIAAVSIGAGPDGTVYATTAERELYWLDARERKWKPASGVALAVAVGPSGSPWIIGAESALFASGSFISEYNAVAEARAAAAATPQQVLSLAPPPASVLPTNVRPLAYTQVTGSYADVGVGADGSIFAAGTDGGLYCFSNPERRFLLGSRGSARRVAVSPAGVPWIINANGEVAFFENNNWIIIPGFKADDIGFGADRFVYATQANIVHRYDAATRSFREVTTYNSGVPLRARRVTFTQGALWGVTAENTLLKCTATQCQQQSIGARDLGAGPDGTLMVLDTQGNVQRYNPRSGGFTPAGGTGAVAANSISVGPQGLPWLVSTTGDVRSSGLFSVSRNANLATCAQRFANTTIPATPQSTAQLTANDDSFRLPAGGSASLIGNDQLNGGRPATSSVTVTFSSSSANLTHTNGSITVASGTAAGSTLTGSYVICVLPGAAPCAAARVSVVVLQRPVVVVNNVVNSNTPNAFDVTFSLNCANACTPVTSYTATATPNGGGRVVSATGTASPITITNINPQLGYQITVTGTNAAGTGAASAGFGSP